VRPYIGNSIIIPLQYKAQCIIIPLQYKAQCIIIPLQYKAQCTTIPLQYKGAPIKQLQKFRVTQSCCNETPNHYYNIYYNK